MDEAPTERQIRRAVARVERGMTIGRTEACALLAARGPELVRLIAAAGRVRDAGLLDAGRPAVITYSPKVFIPLTRLCRDRCHYCTFATDPAALRERGEPLFLGVDDVVRIAKAGADAGCTEALFTLGDSPERRWGAAAEWLQSGGFEDTHAYLRTAAVAVLERTGLLPHLNPGVLTWSQIQRLRPVAPSMGLMLESSSPRLFETPGQVHYGSPDKNPAVRLRMIEDAGRQSVPFTTGILVGIGETGAEVVDSILAIRSSAREYGHIQEVIVQNFRAKRDTAARNRPDLDSDAYLATLATARILLGPRLRLQAPPNLSDPGELGRLLAAGVDDLGGISPVTVDHVNPERPWPAIDVLRQLCLRSGFELSPRLPLHPRYAADPQRWVDPRLHAHVRALSDRRGLADPGAVPLGMPWQEQDLDYARFARAAGRGVEVIDITGSVHRGEQEEAEAAIRARADGSGTSQRLPSEVRTALHLAERDPVGLARGENRAASVALMSCDGPALDLLCRLADEVRADAVGNVVTYVVNRNINFTNVCYTGCRFCAFAQRADDPDALTLSLAQVGDRVAEARESGATEICMQGGIHPRMPASAYFDLAAEVKRRAPTIHLHAFSPMEIVSGASRSGMSLRDWLEAARSAGLDSIPGTAAEILDDDVRWILTKGKLPADTWVEVIQTAHSVGLPSSATMMYGHVDRPEHWVDHIATIRSVQERTGGFTEFVPLPFIHQETPIYQAGVARPGPTARDNRAVHAMARLMLHGAIDHIQCSWVKLGEDECAVLLSGGADDLGGTLMEETISRTAGADHGCGRTPAQLTAMADMAGRPAAERTTLYGPIASAQTGRIRHL